MSTEQPIITNLYNGDESDEGTIKYYKASPDVIYPVICVKRWRTFEWIRLNELSAALWMRYRDNVEPEYMAAELSVEVEGAEMLSSLVKMLTMEQRKKWVAEHNEYKDKICMECGSFNPEKKKCIHHDCPGMCSTCFDIKNKLGFEKCACCDKKQEITCPICQEDFTTENTVKSETCNHRICWSCFGRSVKSSRPLSHCPMCRGVFCDKLIDLEEYDDMPPLEEEDDMPPLEDDMPPLVELGGELEYQNLIQEIARAQEGMDFDAIIAAIANGSVSVRNDGLEV
jgi:ribosomal protein L40E